MAEVNISPPVGCSPKPPIITYLSTIEEEKVISNAESTESDITAYPTSSHKVSFLILVLVCLDFGLSL